MAAAPVAGLQVRIAKGETTPEAQGFIPCEPWRASWRGPQAKPPAHGKREVPTVVCSLRTALPATLGYVVMPYPAGESPEARCALLPLEGEGIAVRVSLPGSRERVVLLGNPGAPRSWGGITTRHRLALVDPSLPVPRVLLEL